MAHCFFEEAYMITLHAQPYDMDANGFYFTSSDDFDTKQSNHFNVYGAPVEEYELQFINGSDAVCNFNSIKPIDQCNISEWFEEVEEYEDFSSDKQTAINYLMEIVGKSYKDALEAADDVYIFEGTKEDYAYEFIEDTGALNEMPESLRGYFDYEGLARDMEINGDIYEIERELIVTNHNQH